MAALYPRGGTPTIASWTEAVDLAHGFVGCWTFGGSADAVEEWARQLREELNEVFAASSGATQGTGTGET